MTTHYNNSNNSNNSYDDYYYNYILVAWAGLDGAEPRCQAQPGMPTQTRQRLLHRRGESS